MTDCDEADRGESSLGGPSASSASPFAAKTLSTLSKASRSPSSVPLDALESFSFSKEGVEGRLGVERIAGSCCCLKNVRQNLTVFLVVKSASVSDDSSLVAA